MSQYIRLPQTSTTKPMLDEDILTSLHNIPSNFDLALNNDGTNQAYLSPNRPPKTAAAASLLDPEGFRRLSTSTISSMPLSRGVSPFPHAAAPTEPKTWKHAGRDFWDRNQGMFLVSASQFFGALMNVAARLLEIEGGGMHPFQILFARMGLTLVFCCAWMWWKKVPHFPLGAKGIRWLLVSRGLSGFFGIYGVLYSLQYLPIADTVVLTFLSPSVASYGCYLFLREPFPRASQYASLISLLGVVLIARPTSFFSSSASPPVSGNTTITTTTPAFTSAFPTPTSAQRLSAVAVSLLGVLGAAGAITSIRYIGARAHPLISVNYFATFCTLVSLLALTLSRPLHLSSTLHFALPQGVRQWSMLVFIGVCGFVFQFLLTMGLAAGGRGRGVQATNFIYTNMLFAVALDKVVFGVSPGWASLAGGGLILGSAVFVAVQKQQGGVGKDADEEEAGDGGVAGTEEEMQMLSGGADEAEAEEEELTT